MDSQVPQHSLQFWDVELVLLLQFVIFEIPGVLNWVEVGKIAMSVNGVCVLLFKPLLHLLCPMSWSTIRLNVNAHSALWHSYTDDQRRQLIAEVISNSDHISLNTDTPTRVPNTALQQTSSPDITTVSNTLYNRTHQLCPRYEGQLMSDGGA